MFVKQIAYRSQAPPHARGWTVPGAGEPAAQRGSPARAGMDRGTLLAGAPGPGLPRTRGDGPEMMGLLGMVDEAPPHARGWTGAAPAAGRRRGGSPARAGMDPSSCSCFLLPLGLPRTRGDGPLASRLTFIQPPAPPHARGWTHFPVFIAIAIAGSPARAGMDPGRRCRHGTARGLPRTRGDGPSVAGLLRPWHRAPPHARGWTPEVLRAVDLLEGSPARAGMDPSNRSAPSFRVGLPRTRGDGPHGHCVEIARFQAPPHARGWTHDTPDTAQQARGSPARAGMDRAAFLAFVASIRLPRTRGDGPAVLTS